MVDFFICNWTNNINISYFINNLKAIKRITVNDFVVPFDIPITHYTNESKSNIGQEGEVMIPVPKEIVEIMQTDEVINSLGHIYLYNHKMYN